MRIAKEVRKARELTDVLVTASTAPIVLTLAVALAFASGVEPTPAHAEVAHADLAAEALYSEALIAFSKQKSDDAVQLLDRALQGDPNHYEALELKALILKGKGTPADDLSAIGLYQRLVQLRGENDSAPYQFELGVLQHRQKNTDEARSFFQKSLERKFNTGASHFFLGLMDYEAEDLESAENHFKTASLDKEPELQMSGTFYLGLIQFRLGNPQKGADLLAQAREQVVAIKDTAATPGLRQAADRMLAPFDRGRFFANVALIPMYDSNVGLQPVTGPLASSPTQSIAARAAAGFGYITSPMKASQFVYALRGSTNINTAQAALPYQFLTVAPSVNWNWHPLARNRFGAWLSLERTIQYSQDSTGTWGYDFFDREFSMIPTVGVNYASPLSDDIQLRAHFLLRHTDYKASGYGGNPYYSNYWSGLQPPPRFLPSPENYSGDLHQLRLSAQMDNGMGWLNPSAWFIADWYNARKDPGRYGAITLGAGDQIRFNRQHTLNASLELTGTRFYESDRSDGTLQFHVNHVYQLSPGWSLIGDVTYTWNTSSWYEVSYSRTTAGVGVGWSL